MRLYIKRAFVALHHNIIVIVFALIVGVFSVLPHFLAVNELGSLYKGIPFMYTDNEEYYLARIQEIADGHLLVSSPYFYEYKDSFPLLPPVSEYVYYFISILFRISLPQTLVVTKFLFPATLFLLVYSLIKKISAQNTEKIRTLTAIAGGFLVTLGYDLVDHSSLFSRLRGEKFGILSLWTRPVNPVTGALIIFGLLLILWRLSSKNHRQLLSSMLAGVLLASSVGYFFSFVLTIIITGVLAIVSLIRRNFNALKNISTVLVVGLALNSIYWINVWKMIRRGGEEFALRNGMIFTHMPLLNKILIAALLFFVALSLYQYLKAPKETKLHNEAWWWFSLSLLVSGLIALNQQVITGRAIWPYHFVQYTIPLAMIVSLVVFYNIIYIRSPRIFTFFVHTLIFAIIIFSIWSIKTYTYRLDDFKKIQQYQDIFSWINEHAPPDCVVLIKEQGDRFTNLIPAFTHCNIYTSSYLNNTMPRERILHNYLVRLRLARVRSDNISEWLENHERDVRSYFYEDWHQLFNSNRDPKTEPVMKEIAKAYKEQAGKDFAQELKRYRIDYLITEGVPPIEIKSVLPTAEQVWEHKKFHIYKIK